MAGQESPTITRTKRKSATQHGKICKIWEHCIQEFCLNLFKHHIIPFAAGGSTPTNLQQALEDYLPVLLGLVKDGKRTYSM